MASESAAQKAASRPSDALAYLPTMYLNKGKPFSSIDDLYKAWSTSAMLKLSESKQCAYRIANNRLDSIRFLKVHDITIETLQTCVDTFGTSFYTKRDMKALLFPTCISARSRNRRFSRIWLSISCCREIGGGRNSSL